MKTSTKFILLFVFCLTLSSALFIWRSSLIWQKNQKTIEAELTFSKIELSSEQLKSKIDLVQKLASQNISSNIRNQLETLSVEFVGEVFKEEGKWRLKWEGVSSNEKNRDIASIKTIPWSTLARSQPFWYNDKEGRVIWVKPLPSIDLHYLVIGFNRALFPLYFSNVDNKHDIYTFSEFENQPMFLDKNWSWLVGMIQNSKLQQGSLKDSKNQNWYFYRLTNLGLVLFTPYNPPVSFNQYLVMLCIIAGITLVLGTLIFASLAKKITQKISLINAFMQGENDGSEVMEISGTDEIGVLASNAIQFKKNIKTRPIILEKKSDELLTSGAFQGNSSSKAMNVMQILRGVVYAIKPPTMSLLGFSKLGKEVDNLKESAEFFSAIRREAEHIKRFIDKISSRENELEGNEAMLDLNDAILISLKSESEKIKKHGLKVEKKLTESLNVYASSEALNQAVHELIKNAIDASLQTEAGVINITSGKVGNEVVLSIENSGAQINNVNQMLEPFYTTKSGGHTGLGLTLVVELLKQQGAKLELFPRASGGIKATIHWPDAIATMQEKRVQQLIHRNEHTTEQQLLEIYRADQKAMLGGKKPLAGSDLTTLPRLPTESERLGFMKLSVEGDNENVKNALDSTNTVQGRDVTLAATRTHTDTNDKSSFFSSDDETNHEKSVLFSSDTNTNVDFDSEFNSGSGSRKKSEVFELEQNELTVGGLKIKFKNKGAK